MFENYRDMSAEEKDRVKAAHRAARAGTSSRYGNLAWGFVRGFPYRRIERATRRQEMPDGSFTEHNRPDAAQLTRAIAESVPSFAVVDKSRPWDTKAHPEVVAWLAREDGAVPVPVREKRKWAGDLRTEVA
jgi:hypothetical protein